MSKNAVKIIVEIVWNCVCRKRNLNNFKFQDLTCKNIIYWILISILMIRKFKNHFGIKNSMAGTWQSNAPQIVFVARFRAVCLRVWRKIVKMWSLTNEFSQGLHTLQKMLEKRAALQPIFGVPARAIFDANPQTGQKKNSNCRWINSESTKTRRQTEPRPHYRASEGDMLVCRCSKNALRGSNFYTAVALAVRRSRVRKIFHVPAHTF